MRRFSKLAAQKAKLLLLQLEAPAVEAPPQRDPDPRPEMLCFRRQTLALVRHFFELSSQVGRLPSLLGREFFRARVSHHAIPSFEEQAVFVCDVERCLARLRDDHAQLIALIGLYRFSHDEAAEILHRSSTKIREEFLDALDALTEIFLRARLLTEDRPDRRQMQHGRLPAEVAALGRKPPQSVKVAYGAEAAGMEVEDSRQQTHFSLA